MFSIILQINWLVSIWWGALVVNGLINLKLMLISHKIALASKVLSLLISSLHHPDPANSLLHHFLHHRSQIALGSSYFRHTTLSFYCHYRQLHHSHCLDQVHHYLLHLIQRHVSHYRVQIRHYLRHRLQ